MTSITPELTGTVPFHVPSINKTCSTWYKIIGSPYKDPTIKPLIAIHGGPGGTHESLFALSELYKRYDIPVILYDQIGNGRSTHLPETKGDEDFWTEKLFHAELSNLIEKLGFVEKGYDVLGHSWGGMMSSTWAAGRPKGLRRLVLSNSPASMELWENAANRYREALPGDVKEKLKSGAEEGGGGEEYEEAMGVYFKRHGCSTEEMPTQFVETLKWMKSDDTVDATMNGPNEFECTGSLKGWSAVEAAKNIEVPTLVLNGTNEAADDEAVKPLVEGIKDVKWVKFGASTHSPMFEEPDKYFETVGEWLRK